MFVYSENDVMRLFYSDLPQTTISKAINNLRKRRNACVSADGGHFEHYYVNLVVALNMA